MNEIYDAAREMKEAVTDEDRLEFEQRRDVVADATALAETLWLLNRVITAADTSIVVTDPNLPDNPIIYHNPAFEHVSGYTASEIDRHNCRFLQGPGTDPEAVAEMRAAVSEGRSCDVTMLNYRKDGTPFWNHLAISPVRDGNGKLTHFVGVQNDVTQQREAEQERDTLLAQQRRIADTLQRALLLDSPSTFHGLEINTQYEPALDEAQFGGDFFDVFALGEDLVALVVGDCTGKGLDAAQHTAEVKFALRVLLREHSNPLPALARLNGFHLESQRLDGRDPNALVCVLLAIVNTRSGLVTLTSAGMEPPLVIREDGDVEEVPVLGMMIGVDAEAEFTETQLLLEPGDVLLMVTDGITEARSPGRRLFGYDGLIGAVREAATLDSVAAMGRKVVASAKEFAGGKPQDDICLLAARRPRR
ncbi:MAG: SpoIIE family protein phosphatase [Cytophagales bacterium]|nr:SpoIIE family protein phosphatase [Armatimonadota bacterium]